MKNIPMLKFHSIIIFLLLFNSFAFSQQYHITQSDIQEIENLIRIEQLIKTNISTKSKKKQREIYVISQRLNITGKTLQNLEKKSLQIKNKITLLNKTETNKLISINDNRYNLSVLISALIILQKDTQPAIIFSSKSTTKAARTSLLLSNTLPLLDKRIVDLKTELDNITAIRSEKLIEQTKLISNANEIKNRQSIIKTLLQAKEKELRSLNIAENNSQQKIANLAAKASNLKAALQTLQELKNLKKIIRPTQKPKNNAYIKSNYKSFLQTKGRLKIPVIGTLIAEFGDKIGSGRKLTGLRFRVPKNAIILSPVRGKVAAARALKPAGNTIVLDLGDNYYMLFLGLGKFFVKEGEIVTPGSILAYSPANKIQHIDIEIRKSLTPIDPKPWFSLFSK